MKSGPSESERSKETITTLEMQNLLYAGRELGVEPTEDSGIEPGRDKGRPKDFEFRQTGEARAVHTKDCTYIFDINVVQ